MSSDFARGALAAIIVVLAAWTCSSHGCDRFVLSGYAHHADRSHGYNSYTWGFGCEWVWSRDWRGRVMLFDNSNDNLTLLPAAAWLPVHVGRWSAGLGAGVAFFGYDNPQQKAGGLMLEYMERDVGGDATLVPRVLGMKGIVLWLNGKIPIRDGGLWPR